MARGTWWARTGCWTGSEVGAQVGVTRPQFWAGPTAQAPRFLPKKLTAQISIGLAMVQAPRVRFFASFLRQNVGK
jgi:hypothetical protein